MHAFRLYAGSQRNRRAFLAYSWVAMVGLVSLQQVVATDLFMYPRFRAGEFGGEFPLGPAAALSASSDSLLSHAAGKYWLVNTEQEPRALYMVCPHLGCLYKWVAANCRFG